MAAQKPVISIVNDNTETAKIIDKSKCGYIVRPGDSANLVKFIKRLYNEKKILKRCAGNSYDYFLKNFERKIQTNKFVELLDKI